MAQWRGSPLQAALGAHIWGYSLEVAKLREKKNT